MSSSLAEAGSTTSGALRIPASRRMPGRGVRALVPPPQPLDRSATSYVLSSALVVVALLAGTLVLELVGVGALRHAHDQRTTYASFRTQLANGVAPIGQTDVRVRLLRPGSPVAVLRIPAIGVDEVVLEGTTSTVTMSGPGHQRDTALPGQFGASVVYSRGLAYGAPFHRLSSLRPGQLVLVTTGQSQQPYTYVVQDVRRAGDPVPVLQPHTGRLTLATSDGPWYAPSGVLRVDAVLKGTPSPRTAKVVDGVGPAETAMAHDPAAWTPLLLWAQGLLLSSVAFIAVRQRWDRMHAWLAGFPLLALVALETAHQVARLLPNLI